MASAICSMSSAVALIAAASVYVLVTRMQLDSEVLNLLPSGFESVEGLKVYNRDFSQVRDLTFALVCQPEDVDKLEEFVPQFEQKLREQPFVPLARRISHHEAFGEAGANVHFIEIPSRNQINIRSYERGVEDETLACGSGCTATAIATFSKGECDPPVHFLPQSGIPPAP
jgi:hypothetical protein